MSLYGMMRTGVSGMNAQANRLSTVADNIANSSTTGYKRASTEFSSLVLPSTSGSYNSGGVTTTVVNSISKQGALQFTTSVTDLAIDGDGFFVVQDPSGTTYLTRAGSFVPDKDGYLVNTAGYRLQGWDLEWGPRPAELNESLLKPIRINDAGQYAAASTSGMFTANLPSSAADVASIDLPGDNGAGGGTPTYTAKSSLVAYDGLGSKVILDVYFTKSDVAAGTWEVAIFDQSETPTGGFPYNSAPLKTQTLKFDGTGQLTGASAKDITLIIPGGGPMTIDLSGMSQVELALQRRQGRPRRQCPQQDREHRNRQPGHRLRAAFKRCDESPLLDPDGQCRKPRQADRGLRQRLRPEC